MTEKQHGGRRQKAGRKPIGQERGGLVSVLVNIYADQAEWLGQQQNKQQTIRDAIDLLKNDTDRP